MDNPFIYGKEVSGAHFCNRKSEIRELACEAQSGQNIIIFSPRRFGKTSLIKKVFEVCQKKGMLTIYVDLYAALTEVDVVQLYARAVAQGLCGGVKRKINEIAKLFTRIRPAFTVDRTGEISYSMTIDPAEVMPSLEDVLESVERYARRRKKKAVVCFDEFQQIGQFKSDKIEKIMRSVIQRHKNTAYIFMGSKKHLMHTMFNNPHRPFYRSAQSFPLEKIKNSELHSFIRNKFIQGKIVISDTMVHAIINESESHPYYVQYLSHILWERTREKGKVTSGDITKCLELLLARETSTYEATWDLLTIKQRQVLVAVVKMMPEDKVFSSEFLMQHKLKSAATLQRTLKSLMEKDLIEKENNQYVMHDVFFKKWLNRM